MLLRTTAIATLIGIGIFGGASAVHAQSPAHIDNLAATLQRQTAALHAEVHAHFRRTPDYVHLDRDVAEMEQLARHIHDVAHRGGSVYHLRGDVAELDRLFHHVEDLVDRLVRTRQIDFRTVVHFRRVMSDISGTLHHLRDDLNRRPMPVVPHYGPARSNGLDLPGIGLRIRW